MLSINQQIYEAGDLSAKAQIVLGWLPESQTWINNLASRSEDVYAFYSEADLLNQVLYGLYSTTTFLLQKCDIWASPERYLALAERDLSIINAVETGAKDKTTLSRYNQVLASEDIISDKQLGPVSTFLTTLYADQVIVSALLSHDTRIRLLELAEQVNAHQYENEEITAARIFIQNRTIDESTIPSIANFAFDVLDEIKNDNQDSTETMSVDAITTLMEKKHTELVKIAMAFLSCPQLQQPFRHEHINVTINSWGENEVVIGFTDLPTAITQINRLLVSISQSDSGKDIDVQGLKSTLIEFMSQSKVKTQVMSQDAVNWYYHAETSKYAAVFVLGESGILSLDSIKSKTLKEDSNDE